MSAEDYDKQVEELAAQYERAGVLMSAILVSATTPQALRAASATAQTYLTALLSASEAWIREALPRVYLSGVGDALRATGDERDAREVVQAPEHREALQTLAESLLADLQNAAAQMGRDFDSALGEIRRRRIAEALASRDPVTEARGMAREMRERGIKFVDRAGRRWKPKHYAETVLLTHVASVLNTGTALTAAELGSPGVRVRDGKPGQKTDEPCETANGQAWSLAFWLANLLAHPRCRRAGTPLSPRWQGTLDRVMPGESREVAA
jgi:hypothetical protein